MDNIKLICVDLDGTLLNDDKEFTAFSKAIIAKAREQGVKFSFCTGRSPYACMSLIKSWQAENIIDFIIGFNGSLVLDYQSNRFYPLDTLDGKNLPKIFEYIKGTNYEAIIFDEYSEHATKITDRTKQIAEKNYLELKLDDLSGYYDKQINKLLCIMDKDQLDALLKDAPNYVTPDFKAVRSNTEYLEFIHPNLSKTNGIRKVCELLNISLMNVLSFGDELNDMEMISDTIGVAMKNANPLIKAKARYITEFDNNHDGLARFIEANLLKSNNARS